MPSLLSRYLNRHLIVGGVLAVYGCVTGCATTDLIPNTKLRNTDENRELVRTIETYRVAMERRDTKGVFAMLHPSYFDTVGTPDGADDLNYDGVRQLLQQRFEHAQRIRYRIEYHNVKLQGDVALVDTWIDAAFQYEDPPAPVRWRQLTDYNRFVLRRVGMSWKFVSGI